MPMIQDDISGELLSLFVWLAEQRKAFEDLARASGIEIQITSVAPSNSASKSQEK